MGELHYFMGVEVTWTGHTMVLSQTKYIFDLLKKKKMDGSILFSSPMCSSKK